MASSKHVSGLGLIESPQPFWASQTIWSAFAVVGSSAGAAFLAWKSGDMAAFGASLTAVLGGINTIVGRFRAASPIAR